MGHKKGCRYPRADPKFCCDLPACQHKWHCWHDALVQHAVPYHRDVVCCHCGTPKCVRLPAPKAPDGHGKYYPL